MSLIKLLLQRLQHEGLFRKHYKRVLKAHIKRCKRELKAHTNEK